MEALIALLGGIALFFLAIAYSTFSWGYVTYKFYYWFVLPVFTDLPAMSLAQAVGIALFISLFKNHSSKKTTGNETNWPLALAQPWVVVFVGWIIYCFIK